METLSGNVSGLQRSTLRDDPAFRERGEASKTTRLTEFWVGARAVQHTGALKIDLNEGDFVHVAGPSGKKGPLRAEAIRNATTGAVGSVSVVGWVLMIAFVVVFGLVGSIAATVFLGKMWLFPLFMVFDFAAVGLVCARALQTRKALAWVRLATP